MKPIEELAELFKTFPSVGPRQAKRFVYHLLTTQKDTSARIATLIKTIRENTVTCTTCQRFFPKQAHGQTTCEECRDTQRDPSILAIVPRDTDRDAIEKSKTFKGYYFVLGGTVPILGEHPEKRIRLALLLDTIKRRVATGLKEIIIAMDANPEGDYTAEFLCKAIQPLAQEFALTLTVLGRGFSTGTELEYADAETIQNALVNRSKIST